MIITIMMMIMMMMMMMMMIIIISFIYPSLKETYIMDLHNLKGKTYRA